MNTAGPIAFVVAGVWLLAGVVWLLSGAEKADEALADLGVDDDEQPIPYRPTDPTGLTGPEDDPAWNRHCRQALGVANSATSWTALDDAQAQRWIRTHPASWTALARRTAMTTVPLDSPASPAAQLVTPDPDTRLAQLLAQYDLAKAEADKAAETLGAITTAIKAELVAQAPDATDIRVESEHLARPLRLVAVTSWRVDAQRLKKEAPETYVRYAKQSTVWRLSGIAQ